MRRSSPTPKSTDSSTPAGSRRIAKRAQDLYANAATIIADQVSYIYLYNPSVIQAWNTGLSGFESRRDGAVRFRTSTLAQGQTQ